MIDFEEDQQEQIQNNIATADVLNRRQDRSEQQQNIALEETPFLPPSWEHYLDLLQDLCHHRNVLIAVTGPEGAGKTTLMCQFIEIIHNGDLTHSITQAAALSSNLHICTSSNAQTCQLFAHTDLDKQQLLTLLTEGFNLPPVEGATLDERLHAQVLNLQDHSRLCILLIDNAENLPAETLSALLNIIQYQSDAQMNFHVVLFGSNTLQNSINVLAQDEINVGLTLTLPLTPFSLEETKNYIQQQLENNVFTTNANLTTPIVETIYKLSEGIPAKINKVAQRLLLASDQQKTGTTMSYFDKIRNNQTKLVGGLLLLTLIFASSFLLNKKTPPASPEILNESEAPAKVAAPVNAQPTDANTSVMTLQTQEAATPTPPPAATKTQPAKSEKMIIQTAPVTEAAPIAEEPATTPAPQAAAPAVVVTPAPAEVAPASAAATPTHSEKPFSYTAEEKYLLGVGPENYTLQIFAGHNTQDVIKFIKQNHLGPKVRYFRAYKMNQPWVILVYGVYSDAATAKGEVNNLPSNLQKFKPWPRNFKAIHQEITAARAHAQ